MNASVSLLHAQDHKAELRRAASRSRRRGRSDTPARAVAGVAIRQAGPADANDLKVLAQLEGRPFPAGPTLVALQEGAVRAALPLDGAAPLADPFRRTAEIVELLIAERRQLRRRRRPGRGRRLLAALFGGSHSPVSAPVSAGPVVPGSETLLDSGC